MKNKSPVQTFKMAYTVNTQRAEWHLLPHLWIFAHIVNVCIGLIQLIEDIARSRIPLTCAEVKCEHLYTPWATKPMQMSKGKASNYSPLFFYVCALYIILNT